MALACCLQSKERKYECATRIDSMTRYHRGVQNGPLKEAVGLHEEKSPVLHIALWNTLATAKSGADLQERDRRELIHCAPAGLLIVSYMVVGIVEFVGQLQVVALV